MSGHEFAVREQPDQATEPAPAHAPVVVSAAHDAAEREAERVADEVLVRLASPEHDTRPDAPPSSLARTPRDHAPHRSTAVRRMLKQGSLVATPPPTVREVVEALSNTEKPVDAVKPTIDEFLSTGAKPDSACTDNGEATTILHIAARYRREPDLVGYLLTKGADVQAPDARGRTPLHAAARTGKTDSARLLVRSFGANPLATDQAGWTAYDVAVAAGFKACAVYLAGELRLTNPTGPDPEAPPGLAPGPNTTPAILAAATKSMDPGMDAVAIRKMYEDLYTYQDLRLILDIAALEAVQSRADDPNALRIFLSDSDNVTPLRSGGGYGSYNDTTQVTKGVVTHKLEGTATLAGKIPAEHQGGKGVEVASQDRMVLGNMIHELTHHAARKVFGNSAIPLEPGNLKSLELYLAAYREDSVRWVDTDLAPGTTAAREVGFDQVESYQQSLVQPLQEIIVRAPQTLVQYGAVAEKALPSQLAYFRGVFLPAAEKFVLHHSKLGSVAPPTNPGKASFDDVGGTGPEGVKLSDLTAARLTSMVVGRITNARHTTDIGATLVDTYLTKGLFDPPALGFEPTDKKALQDRAEPRGELPDRLDPKAILTRLETALKKARPKKLNDRVLPVDEVDALVAALANAVMTDKDVTGQMTRLLKVAYGV